MGTQRMSTPHIEMYTTSWCPYCERARALLRGKGVAFDEISLEAEPARREEMIRRSGRRTVPQIFIDGQHIGGSDDLHALESAGGLEPLLRRA
ncbi:MAG: glutaredoxin 3 [Pseudomonadota bacterium]|jgi:glutaredoxin 3